MDHGSRLGLTLLGLVLANVFLVGMLAMGAHATTFQVVNNALGDSGGQRFDTELGNTAMRQVLIDATNYIQGQFSLSTPKDVTTVTLFVEDMSGVAYTSNNEIHLSASYVDGFTGDLTYEITGVLYHECTHVWQNNNAGGSSTSEFSGTIEGMADTIRLRAGWGAKSWVQDKTGSWYAGYSNTAYFFNWIEDTKKQGFINELNQDMANPWTTDFFTQITGTDVNTLWQQYQSS